MRIKPFLYGVVVLVVFLGTIFIFQSAGVWSVSGKVTSNGDQAQPSATDVNTIKGWMTLEQISTTYNVPLADILNQFNLPPDTASTAAIKDLESDQFSVTNLRTWLQGRIGPSQTGDSTSLPSQQTNPTSVASTNPAPLNAPAESTSTPAVQPTEHVVADKTLTGKTTFQEILDWGLPAEIIQNVIGGELPEPSVVVKDFVTQKGMEFTSVKTALQAELDKLK